MSKRWDADSNKIAPSATSKLMSVDEEGGLRHVLPNELQAYVQAKIFGTIAHDAVAPTPGETGEYTFSTGGVCAWLDVFPVDKNVVAGDTVKVIYDVLLDAYSYELVPNEGSYATVGELEDETAARTLADSQFYAKAIEPVAFDAEAPTPNIPIGTTKTYEFSTGGAVSWLGNQVVKQLDKAEVTRTDESAWARAYQTVQDYALKANAFTNEAFNSFDALMATPSGIIEMPNHGFLATNGGIVANEDYRTSNLIQIERLRGCRIRGLYNIQNLEWPIAFYDINENLIDVYSPIAESGDISLVLTPSLLSNYAGAYYIRLCSYFIATVKYDLFKEGIVTVSKTNGNYDNIQDAIDNCLDSESNPVIIFVYPGVYPRFSMVEAENKLRYISIIGLDKHSTIIEDKTGNYYTPPAEIRTNGVIKNLTFRATHEDETGATPGHLTSYACHMDFGTQNVLFQDCICYSENGCAVGVGMHQDERIEFHSCDFESNISAEYWPYAYLPDYGALFIHSSTNGELVTNQNIVLDHCHVVARNPLAIYAAFLTSISEVHNFSPYIYASLIGNTFNSGQNVAKLRMEFNINSDSHGNNNTNLNIESNSSILV